MRPIVSLLLLLMLGAPASEPAPPAGWPIVAHAVPLDPGHPGKDRVGALRWLGGWVLTSRDPRFGGISAMAVSHGRFLAIGDTGGVFRFALRGGEVVDSRIGALPAGPGAGAGKLDRDAESLAADPADNAIWIGFEQHNAVWRYDASVEHAQAHDQPPAMAAWPLNGGPEAMARLNDGRFIILAEEAPGPQASTEGLLFNTDPAVRGMDPIRFGYRAPAGYVATDIAALPDGRLLVINRRYTPVDGVSAILTMIDPQEIRPDAVLKGRELARLVPPLTVDNMEALAVTREGGRTIVWIASDDNFNPLQRTLLLKFALEERQAR